MKKHFVFLLALLLLAGASLQAQTKYSSKTGTVKFMAESALQDANAENHQVRVVLDATTKELAVSLLISSFEFEKALMQTHFNSDMDSEKFPKATFSGKIVSPETLPANTSEAIEVKVTGDLTIHGVAKKLENVSGTLKIQNGKLTVHSEFTVSSKDYKVPTRPGVKETVKIVFDAVLTAA